jgi:two-component system, OmpR family, sensor kinase
MFTGLRIRLLGSYILVIVLTLLVISVALFLVLRTRSQLTDTTTLRLYNFLTQIDAAQAQQTFALNPDGLTRLQQAALNRLDKRYNVRIVLLDASGKVSYDTRQGYQNGQQADMNASLYTLPQPPDELQFSMTRGTLRNPDGSEWIFVAQTPGSVAPQRNLLFMVAIKAPPSLGPAEVVQYYGPDLLVPLLQAGVIGLLVAVVLSLVITRSVARPLQDVAAAAAAVAGGQLDQKVPIGGPAEVRTVAEAFNHMTEQVQTAQVAQRDFLANVTHDLRTPLTSIQGFSQAIIDGVASDPGAAQRAAQIIYDEAGRLNRMVQELLDLARIEAGRFSMRRHSIRLDELLNSVGERISPRALEKGLKLTLDVPELPPIGGDGDRLVQVYTNLLDNAIKHTPRGGIVTLRATLQDGGVLTQVGDSGEGIPAVDLPHIFDRFYQVDKSRQSERREGAGLGLTITKGIIEAHGGQLRVDSQEGVGTMFSIWLPLAVSDASTVIRRRSGLFKTPAPKPLPPKDSSS